MTLKPAAAVSNDSDRVPSVSLRLPLRRLRGYCAVAVVGCLLLVSDVLQRTVVAGAARLLPRARRPILTFWIRLMRLLALELGTVVLGGARLGPSPRIPSRAGVLVIMNHQSLLDIPLVVRAVQGGYPRIVTRRRYARGIPLISHMIRLYQYPIVDPQATVRGHILGLREAARNGDLPLVIFPEGTRTRTGALGPWKRSGLRAILAERRWKVHLMVGDGLWQSRSFPEFVREMSSLDIRAASLGPFASPEPGEDVEAFIEEMRERMEATLEEMRRGAPPAPERAGESA